MKHHSTRPNERTTGSGQRLIELKSLERPLYELLTLTDQACDEAESDPELSAAEEVAVFEIRETAKMLSRSLRAGEQARIGSLVDEFDKRVAQALNRIRRITAARPETVEGLKRLTPAMNQLKGALNG